MKTISTTLHTIFFSTRLAKIQSISLETRNYYYISYKRRGNGQYPIFSRTPYFSAKKHTTVVLKVEVLGQKGAFSFSSMQHTTSVTWKSVRGRFGGSFGLPEEFSCILFDPEDQRASIRVDG